MADLTTDTPESIEVDVDPTTTTLEDLLNLAEAHKAGTISMKGEMEDGTVQWGIVVVCRDGAGELMNNLQVTVDAIVAKWLTATAN